MNLEKLLIVLTLSNFLADFVVSFVITGPVIAAGIATLFGSGGLFYYKTEHCTDGWISPNMTGLKKSLDNRLFGQHLVKDIVYKAVKGHVTNKSPQKALALSFNGWTGCGKNYVSKIIAEHLYRKGIDSSYVHVMIATHDFPHKSMVETYKEQLKRWIVGNVTKCGRSMFIFDEMDKMPEGLVGVLKPFLDHYPDVAGIDFRKCIFLFLSNTGAHSINEETLMNWQRGRKREDMTIKHMDHLINLGAFNSNGGFWHTTLIEKHLIDYFVPFLPLERAHIKQCALVDLQDKGRKYFAMNLINYARMAYHSFQSVHWAIKPRGFVSLVL
ncbi:predicted protein [Nematostella vectensis]|uniref:Torsin n=1 Tax=Nematostella vectensis TaxID=45351 RepID=A7RYS7_NEMVE|nr:predicted protein [Nematostella vectensis]|eukprot:XP_001635478.1 predicted protein [Nematostella vectensis]